MTDAYKPGYIESLKPAEWLLGRMGDPVELACDAGVAWCPTPAASSPGQTHRRRRRRPRSPDDRLGQMNLLVAHIEYHMFCIHYEDVATRGVALINWNV